MKKHQRIILITLVAMVIIFAIITYLNSDLYYARLLTSAIVDDDKDAIAEILRTKPSCVNVYPTLAPEWWQALMHQSTEYPLVEACRIGNIEVVHMLVESGANVNIGSNFTPLSSVYSQKPDNWYELSLYLIDNGASLNYDSFYAGGNILTDILGHRPGSMLEKYGSEETSEVMLAFFNAIENTDCNKIKWERVLQHAITNDRHEIVEFLIKGNYCAVNDTSTGMTPLMFAARDSDARMVQLLLNAGADPSIVSDEGMTALAYAKRYGEDAVIALLAALY